MANSDPKTNQVAAQILKLQDALLDGRIDAETYDRLKADLVNLMPATDEARKRGESESDKTPSLPPPNLPPVLLKPPANNPMPLADGQEPVLAEGKIVSPVKEADVDQGSRLLESAPAQEDPIASVGLADEDQAEAIPEAVPADDEPIVPVWMADSKQESPPGKPSGADGPVLSSVEQASGDHPVADPTLPVSSTATNDPLDFLQDSRTKAETASTPPKVKTAPKQPAPKQPPVPSWLANPDSGDQREPEVISEDAEPIQPVWMTDGQSTLDRPNNSPSLLPAAPPDLPSRPAAKPVPPQQGEPPGQPQQANANSPLSFLNSPRAQSVARKAQDVFRRANSAASSNARRLSARSSNPYLEKVKGAIAKFFVNAKAAARIAGKQAEHGKISQMTLPGAYWMLGKDIHGTGRFRDEFGDLFTKLDGLLSKIQSLKQAHPASDQPQKLTDRAKTAAGHAVDLTKAKAVEMEANGVLRQLGKRAYEKHGESAGAANLVQPIAQALARLATLDREIRALSESHAGGFLTPKRLLVGGGAVIALVLLLAVASMFKGGDATKELAKKTDLSQPALPNVGPTADQTTQQVHDATSGVRDLTDNITNNIHSQNQKIRDNLTRSKADAQTRMERDAARKAAGEQSESTGGDEGNKENAGNDTGSDNKSWDELGEISYATPINRNVGSDIAVAFSPDGNRLALCGRETFEQFALKVYSVANQQQLSASDLSADGTKICNWGTFASSCTAYLLGYSAGSPPSDAKNFVDIFDVTNTHINKTLPSGYDKWFISADGKRVASAPHQPSYAKDLSRCQVKIRDATTGEISKSFPGTEPIAFSPDGKLLAITALPESQQGKNETGLLDRSNVVSVQDLSTGEEVGTIKFESPNSSRKYSVELLAFSPDSRVLALQDRGGKSVDLWDVSEKKLLKQLTGVPVDSGNGDLVFSPDGKTLALTGNPPNGGMHGIVLLVDWPSGRMAGLTYTEGWTQCAAFSPDGNTLAVSISNGKVKLFRQQTGTKGKLAFRRPRDLKVDRGEKTTPLVTLAIYNQLTEGMTVDEVQQLIGGKAQKSEMNKTITRDKFGTHRTYHSVHTYDGAGTSGSKVTLFFEQSAQKANRFVLVRKQHGESITLTEDFLPHKVGSVACYDMYIFKSEDIGSVMRFKGEYQADGVLRSTQTKMGSLKGGQIEWVGDLSPAAQVSNTQYRRVANGFVQEKKQTEGVKETWMPLIMLGARAGDSWEATPQVGYEECMDFYTVVGFGTHSLRHDNKSRISVTIRQECRIGNLEMVVDATYAKGIGLIDRKTYVLKGGENKLASQHKLVDTAKNADWTDAERAFFE